MKEQYSTNPGTSGTTVSGADYEVSSTFPLRKRVSWGAIFAGVAIAMAVQIVLSLLGVAIGASTIDPLKEQNPAKGIGIGAGIWFVISSLVAMFIGAWVAGRLSGATRQSDGRLHGLLTWSVGTLVTVYLLTTAVGGMIGGAASVLGKAASTGAQSAKTGDLQAQLREMGVDPDALKARAQAAAPSGTLTPTGRTPADSQQAQEQKAQLEQKAREAGDTAARGVSQAAFWSFLLLALSAAAASIGGTQGTRRIERFEPVAAGA